MATPDGPTHLFPGPSSPDAEIVTLIVRLLQAEEWDIRAASAKELGRRRALQAVDALCIAVTDRIWHVRIAAIGALGHLQDTRAVEPLCGALQDMDWYIRLAAIGVLGQLGDARAVKPLCTLLMDTEAPVRSSAADALGQIGDVRAVRALCTTLRDSEPSVRRAAGLALERLGPSGTLPLSLLASPNLTPSQRLSLLEMLAETAVRLPEKTVRYRIGDIEAFCEALCREGDCTEDVRRGAEAVRTEIRNRRDAGTLLRAGARDTDREGEELLRGVSGHAADVPPEEHLRPSDVPEPSNQTRPGLFARLFKRKDRGA